MKNILILTASFGNGHNSVSKAVKEAIENKTRSVNVDIVDIFDIINPKVKEFSSKIYENLTENYPVVYNTIYDIKKTNKNNIFDNLLCTTYYKKFYSYIEDKCPDVIISVFPLCACFVSKIKKEYGIKTTSITIITDVVDSWEWIYPLTDRYLVPSEDIKHRLGEKGVDKNTIEVTGIPVKSTFLCTNNYTAEKDKLLIVASGMTEQDITIELLAQLNAKKKLRTIVVTGRNYKLYEKLSLIKFNNVDILGFVNNMDKLMDEAMFIITKPGGVTVFEAINKGLPLIIKDSGIGQEKGNVDFIKRNNLGIVINKSNDILSVIDEYTKNPKKAHRLHKSINEIKNNMKSNKVADCVLKGVI